MKLAMLLQVQPITLTPATLPAEFAGVKVMGWTWSNIASFINSL